VTTGAAAPDPPAQSDTTVWEQPTRLGYADMLRGYGGTIAPLLAGFSLATIAALVSAENVPRWANWSVLALTLTVALLITTMQLAVIALGHATPPGDRLGWRPEATREEAQLQEVRASQRHDYAWVAFYWRLAGVCYDLALCAFLAGLLLLLIPEDDSVPRIAACVVAGIALLSELAWMVSNWRGVPLRAYAAKPEPDAPDAPALTDEGRRAVLRTD